MLWNGLQRGGRRCGPSWQIAPAGGDRPAQQSRCCALESLPAPPPSSCMSLWSPTSSEVTCRACHISTSCHACLPDNNHRSANARCLLGMSSSSPERQHALKMYSYCVPTLRITMLARDMLQTGGGTCATLLVQPESSSCAVPSYIGVVCSCCWVVLLRLHPYFSQLSSLACLFSGFAAQTWVVCSM